MSYREALSHSKQGVWFFAVTGFVIAVAQLLMLPREVWHRLAVSDWVIIALLLAAPLVGVRQHFRHVEETTREVLNTGVRLALGGYVPLWFGLTLVRRVLNG